MMKSPQNHGFEQIDADCWDRQRKSTFLLFVTLISFIFIGALMMLCDSRCLIIIFYVYEEGEEAEEDSFVVHPPFG
jgi:hypothetical protein